LELSDKTPLHKENFIKIVNEGWLDSMLFHRVLEGFVVQAGQYDSLKMAGMDSATMESMDYRVPAEFDTSLFHKRGALGAARTGNPERASSSLSFYFVQRGPRKDSLIDTDEKRINSWLKDNYFVNSPENKNWKDSLLALEAAEEWEGFYALSDTISKMAQTLELEPYAIPEHQRDVYRTLGGTPHLDQNYTVFGEVIQGMNVVDSIAAVEVNAAGLPDQNVYILSARILE
jgi:peptidyl-prolyl cis-trans isomerase B (cyclophilin B)